MGKQEVQTGVPKGSNLLTQAAFPNFSRAIVGVAMYRVARLAVKILNFVIHSGVASNKA